MTVALCFYLFKCQWKMESISPGAVGRAGKVARAPEILRGKRL